MIHEIESEKSEYLLKKTSKSSFSSAYSQAIEENLKGKEKFFNPL
jgi:hypothetical protein